MRLLATGYSVRQMACSGARASHEIIAADAFGDIDTRECSYAFTKLNFPLNEREIKHIEMISENVDGIIVGSGCETAKLSEKIEKKIIGNPPDIMKEAANKEKLSEYLDDLGIPHPRTYTKSDISSSARMRFPLVAKPIYGGGGTSNILCRNELELRHALKHKNIIFQEFVKGMPASVSVISTGKKAISICVNEQLIGLKSLNCTHQFVYCGNISPLKTKFEREMCDIAEIIVLELGLIGSNGVDFIITDDGFFVIEVNPRFQGSLDTVELCTGLNVVDAHLKACGGELIEGNIKLRSVDCHDLHYAARLIIFAERNCIVAKQMKKKYDCKFIADIPPRGRVLRRGEPLASGIGVGNSREDAFEAAMDAVKSVKRCVI